MNLAAPHRDMVEKNAVKRLNEELAGALIVDEQDMPSDVVRFNSTVTINAGDWNRTIQLVIPSERDTKSDKISIMSLMGMVLIGYSTGDLLRWEFPNGTKELSIVKVKQSGTPTASSILI